MKFIYLKQLLPYEKAFGVAALMMLLFMLVLIFGGVMQLTELADYTHKIHRHPLVVSNAIQSANISIVSMHRDMKDAALSKKKRDLEKALANVEREKRKVLNNLDTVEERFLGDINVIIKMRNDFLAWSNIQQRVIQFSIKHKHAEALSITQGEGADYVEMLIKNMNEIVLFARNKANEFLEDSERQYQQSKRDIYYLGGLVIFSSSIIALIILIIGRKTQRELLEREAQFRSAFENVSVANVVINDHGIIQMFNSVAESTFSYKASEVLGENVTVLMPDEYKNKHDIYIENYLDTGVAHIIGIGREVIGVRKNGEEFPMYLDIGEMTVGGGRSFIGSIRDLSEVKLLEAKLQKRHRMEAIGQLTGGVAHDFNNLLAIMMGNLEVAQGCSAANMPEQKYIQYTLDAVKKAATLTQQLLSYSGQLNLQPLLVDSGDLINETIVFLKRTLGVNINLISIIDNQDLAIYVDPSMFSNVLLNLALNARDAMPDGGSITISNAAIDVAGHSLNEHMGGDEIKAGAYVLITIEDTGTGIEPDVINRVFEPFFTTKDVGKGSGLGLSMVYGAIHQSNGYVRISSELNKGTIISFYMPLVNRRVEQPGVQESQVSYNYKTKTVLLVEDDPMVADVTALTLQELGFCVLRADRAQVALEMLESGDHRIDLLLTDVMMEGGMSGVELARQVAHKNKHLKILLMSGFPDEIIRQGDSENSEFQLLPKPFTRTELLLMLENILSDI